MGGCEEFKDDSLKDAPVRGFLHRAAGTGADCLVLTHGAGANCQSPLLRALAEAFCAVDGIPGRKVAMQTAGTAMRRKEERISIPDIAKCYQASCVPSLPIPRAVQRCGLPAAFPAAA